VQTAISLKEISMKENAIKLKRRDFLKVGTFTVASIAIAVRLGKPVHAADPHIEETDPAAQALGYKHDATKVDKAKFANYKAGDTCANCQLFQAKTGTSLGPMSAIFRKGSQREGLVFRIREKDLIAASLVFCL
jgi:hypothetical protein